MANTQDNLKAAFAGESQANRKYLFFAEKAEKEGQPQVAKLFRAVAAAETIHARKHLQTAGGIGDTAKNLEEAIGGENYEYTKMYPEMIKQAEADGNKQAQIGFTWANKVEEEHHGMYKEALDAVKSGKQPAAADYYVCDVCGYVGVDGAPDKCPVCGAPASRFTKVA
jgi:rubrerythrin